ncbi:hypothetical protein HYV57_04915 [Candidatus Peregrinibacteria bacterium]|nr:hypothetical protein [Candidatus Peregrinibacteria bacterium]
MEKDIPKIRQKRQSSQGTLKNKFSEVTEAAVYAKNSSLQSRKSFWLIYPLSLFV